MTDDSSILTVSNIGEVTGVKKGIATIKVTYTCEGVTKEDLTQGISTILSEPMVDNVYLEDVDVANGKVFAIEFLPGQYDQRADACEQCFKLLSTEQLLQIPRQRLYRAIYLIDIFSLKKNLS